MPDLLTSKEPLRRALTKRSRTPGCVTCGMADVAVTMRQYIETDLKAGRRPHDRTTVAEQISLFGTVRSDHFSVALPVPIGGYLRASGSRRS